LVMWMVVSRRSVVVVSCQSVASVTVRWCDNSLCCYGLCSVVAVCYRFLYSTKQRI